MAGTFKSFGLRSDVVRSNVLTRSSNSNMDLEPSAPYASASSFPSPAEFQNGEDPSLAYEKLQQICEGGAPTSGSFYPKFPFTVSASTKGIGLGIDVTSKVFPSALPQSFQPFPPPLVAAVPEKRPLGPYHSQNKIAYRIPGTGAGSTSTSALQGILQKCGIGTAPAALDTESNKQQHHHVESLGRPTSSRITEKIRNLDDMLRSLDHYSAAKRFAADVRREPDMNSGLDPNGHRQRRPSETSEAPISEQPRTAAVGVSKAISRLEFKAQMDKLTGVIEDRWFYGGSRKFGTKNSVEATESSSSTRNDDLHPPQQEKLPPVSNPPSSMTITNLLEEMLRRVAGLERRLTKRDKQKQRKQKGLAARGRLSVQRPSGKRMASILQRQFRRHAASINQRLDKTDFAIKSLRRQHGEAISPSLEEAANNGHDRETYLEHSNGDVQTGSLTHAQRNSRRTMLEQNYVETGEVKERCAVEECVEDQDIISRNMQQMQDELCTWRKESQCMNHTVEKIQQLFSEQNMEIELCWAAINHLCIDNDTFRDELRAHHKNLQEQPKSSKHVNAEPVREMQDIRAGQEGDTNLDYGVQNLM